MALSQVGLEMAAPIGLGYLADRLLGWLPVLTVLGAIVGLVGGMAHLVIMQRPDGKEGRDEDSGGVP